MELLQQTQNCSDFDIIPDGEITPAFRVLLPEWIKGNGVKHTGLLHVIPGTWKRKNSGMEGQFPVDDQLTIKVAIEGRSNEIGVTLTVVNTSHRRLTDLWANICTSLNHLPGNPDWCNKHFLPDMEPDRYLQGRCWYEKITPTRLFALTGSGWICMHPAPDAPIADRVPLVSFQPSSEADAYACAVESLEGGRFFFQTWLTHCRWCTPCPENACMHLEPFLTDILAPGKSATIQGKIGIHRGTRKSLEEHIALFRAAGRQARQVVRKKIEL